MIQNYQVISLFRIEFFIVTNDIYDDHAVFRVLSVIVHNINVRRQSASSLAVFARPHNDEPTIFLISTMATAAMLRMASTPWAFRWVRPLGGIDIKSRLFSSEYNDRLRNIGISAHIDRYAFLIDEDLSSAFRSMT